MVFSSSIFIYFFIPIFFTLYYLSPAQWRNGLILAASLLFYSAGAGLVTFALLLSVWGNHFLAIRIADPVARGAVPCCFSAWV
jgi:alginate O-acetyltransferase complex protein AlgI